MSSFSTFAPWISFGCFGISTALWLWSAFTPVRDMIDFFVADIQAAGRRNAAAAFFAALAFLVQALDMII